MLEGCEVKLSDELLVYLGYDNINNNKVEDDQEEEETTSVVYWAVDVSEGAALVDKLGSKELCFVELRTLMVATDWSDDAAMADLAIAGHVS